MWCDRSCYGSLKGTFNFLHFILRYQHNSKRDEILVDKLNLSSVFDADLKSQPEGRQIMLETRFTEFPALSVDLMIEYFSDLFSEKWKF